MDTLKLPLLKDRRKKLKLTVVYKCLNGLMVMPSNIFFSVNHSSWNLRSHAEAYFSTSHLHTPIVVFIPVSQVLCPYGTNCLRTLPTVSPFLLLNPLSIMLFFRVNFALAYTICSSCVYMFRDSENAQRNLEIAQILRLRGIYISNIYVLQILIK